MVRFACYFKKVMLHVESRTNRAGEGLDRRTPVRCCFQWPVRGDGGVVCGWVAEKRKVEGLQRQEGGTVNRTRGAL